MALLVVEHGWQEFADENEVGCEVDAEDLVEHVVGVLEDGFAVAAYIVLARGKGSKEGTASRSYQYRHC